MKEKPRLKDTGEILDSLKGTRGGSRTERFPAEEPPAETGEDRLIESRLSEGNPPPRGRAARRRAGAGTGEPQVAEDKNPLDFGKYELPAKKRGRPSKGDTEAGAAPKGQMRQDTGTPGEKTKEGPAGEPGAQPKPKRSRGRRDAAAEPPPVAEAAAPAVEEAAAPPVPAVEEYRFEDFSRPEQITPPQPPETPQELEERLRKRVRPEKPSPPPEEPGEISLLEDEASRRDFLERLSARFEERFTEQFQRKPDGRPRKRKSSQPSAPPAVEDPPFPAAHPIQQEDPDADREAESFMNIFRDQVREEESVRAESFKDTLAEKFLKEREKYLRELGIEDATEPETEPEPAPPARPARRKLNLEIQPEMHMQPEDKGQRPVTYNRFGGLRPLDEEPENPEPEVPRAQAAPVQPQEGAKGISAAPGKKTSEELLLELAAQTASRAARPQPKPKPEPGKAFKLQMPAPDGDNAAAGQKKRRGWKRPGKAVLISAVSTLAALALIAWPLTGWLGLRGGAEPDLSSAPAPVSQEQLTVYETREFQNRGHFGDVLVRKSGILLSNLSVDNYLVIEDIATQGEVRLENVSVGGAIYLRGSAVDSLALHDVQAERIVVANSQAPVTVRASGNSDIAAVEVKTPATIVQSGLTGDAPGVRDVLLRPGQELLSLHVRLSGLGLYTLSTEGEAVVTLEEDTRIEALTAEGPLSLSGGGRVVNLAASAAEGKKTLPLQIKNVAVTNLNLKSPASADLSTQVDNIATADSLSLSGNGGVGSLMINPRFGNGRLLIDISGVNVQNIISNAESRVYSAAGAVVNTLTANESVYQLGGKVNHLIANSDGVIYEKEPDRKTVGSGIRPPQTVADNPNIDFDLSTAEGALPTTVEDDVATTCAHPRESGGFTEGDGSRSNPFQVSTPAQLAHVSAHPSSHYLQTADIDIADDSAYADSFAMIASDGTAFSGVYDGGGFEIISLRITSDAENVGLFAENTGTVRNVRIRSGEISSTRTQSAFVGGVVGLNYQNGTVQACSNGARVNGGSGAYVGGIAGYNFGGRVRDCYNTARIAGDTNVGGLVGVNRENGTVSGSYNAGDVEGSSRAGAVCGANDGAVVANCYFLQETAGAGIGYGSGSAAERTAEELRTAQMVADLSAGLEDTPWIQGGGSYTYPVHKQPESAGEEPEEPAQ